MANMIEFIKDLWEFTKQLWISRPTLRKKIKSGEIKLNKIPKGYKYFLTK